MMKKQKNFPYDLKPASASVAQMAQSWYGPVLQATGFVSPV